MQSCWCHSSPLLKFDSNVVYLTFLKVCNINVFFSSGHYNIFVCDLSPKVKHVSQIFVFGRKYQERITNVLKHFMHLLLKKWIIGIFCSGKFSCYLHGYALVNTLIKFIVSDILIIIELRQILGCMFHCI